VRKKLPFFSKINVMIETLEKLDAVYVKKRQFFRHFLLIIYFNHKKSARSHKFIACVPMSSCISKGFLTLLEKKIIGELGLFTVHWSFPISQFSLFSFFPGEKNVARGSAIL
jgi:hypothetical protein